MNNDSFVNGLDVDAFVHIVVAGGGTGVSNARAIGGNPAASVFVLADIRTHRRRRG